MKIYGYKDEDLSIEQIEPSILAEITICGSSIELRKIAAFLNVAADNMERLGVKFDHEHLADKYSCFNDSPHFIVFNSDNLEK